MPKTTAFFCGILRRLLQKCSPQQVMKNWNHRIKGTEILRPRFFSFISDFFYYNKTSLMQRITFHCWSWFWRTFFYIANYSSKCILQYVFSLEASSIHMQSLQTIFFFLECQEEKCQRKSNFFLYYLSFTTIFS